MGRVKISLPVVIKVPPLERPCEQSFDIEMVSPSEVIPECILGPHLAYVVEMLQAAHSSTSPGR